jgi:hypothetical protein
LEKVTAAILGRTLSYVSVFVVFTIVYKTAHFKLPVPGNLGMNNVFNIKNLQFEPHRLPQHYSKTQSAWFYNANCFTLYKILQILSNKVLHANLPCFKVCNS